MSDHQIKQDEISDAIESLMICFGFTSIHEIRNVAQSMIGRSDDQSFALLLQELHERAMKKSESAFQKYEQEFPREAAIDKAVRRLVVGG